MFKIEFKIILETFSRAFVRLNHVIFVHKVNIIVTTLMTDNKMSLNCPRLFECKYCHVQKTNRTKMQC